MRTNLPVTTVEYPITDATLIVSRTDTKGKLTYFNDEFVAAAGFTEAELMGQPHNIIRHPDMPPEAFENLWDTLQAGKPWAGAVKNRRKNGDFYWVLATRVAYPGEWPNYRLYLDPDQAARRPAPGSRTGLRPAARQEGPRLPNRCRHHPPPFVVRPSCCFHRHSEGAPDHAGRGARSFHADHRSGRRHGGTGWQYADKIDL